MAAVVVIHQQEQQQRDRPSMRRSSRLAVTDEFWILPTTMEDDVPPSEVHHQLLLSDSDVDVSEPMFEDLKGYDHHRRAATEVRRRQRPAASVVDSLHLATKRPQSSQSQSSPAALPRRSWLLSFALPKSSSQKDHLLCLEEDNDMDDEEEEDDSLPGMTSGSDDSSASSSSEIADDLSVVSSSSTSSIIKPSSKGVSFAQSVRVRPIPHSSSLSPCQRRRMYSTSMEVRQNKIRNKREYRYDGCDWRNATEEWEMGVDMVSGELVHPAHEHGMIMDRC